MKIYDQDKHFLALSRIDGMCRNLNDVFEHLTRSPDHKIEFGSIADFDTQCGQVREALLYCASSPATEEDLLKKEPVGEC